MRYIGFKNFRKFEMFPNIELAPITMLVGGNNAGKSTVVKGILALSDFFSMRNEIIDDYLLLRDESNEKVQRIKKDALKNIKFYFNTSYLAHIGTFKRALYNKAKPEDSIITFKTDLGPLEVEIDVTGNRNDEELVYGTVSKVRIYIVGFCINADFDLFQDTANITFHPSSVDDLPDYFRRRDFDSLKKYFNSFDKDYTVNSRISDYWMPNRTDFIGSLLESLEIGIDSTLCPSGDKERGRYYKEFPILNIDDETKKILNIYCECFNSSFMGPRRLMSGIGFRLPYGRIPYYRMPNIEYLYAHAVTQTVIYSAKDTNDYLSKTIHEFAPLQSHKAKRDFIIKWMKEFGIGQNFTIKSVGGEAHLVWIVNNDGEKVNLADKGMGSIQLMVLLFRLAITLPQNRREHLMPNERLGKIIIIEEPEQNLHPRLQSKLADLFYELNKSYGYSFLIETHSEYLIRRSQVIVANENYEDEIALKKNNPFVVYYFDEKNDTKPYYPMEYEISGAFKEKFGPGFFDEASKWDMTIIRKEFELKKKNKK